MPTHYEYAVLSEEVYRRGAQPLPADWEVYLDFTPFPEDKGYFGAAYLNTTTGEIIIAHRGANDQQDVLNNYAIYQGNVPQQFSVSADFTDLVISTYQTEFGVPPTVTHTGHSLGAVLAELNGVIDGVSVVNFDSYGSLPILEKLLAQTITDPELLDVITYNAAPNAINSGTEHVGTILRVFPEFDPTVEDLVDVNYADFQIFTDQQHDMINILNLFDPVTGIPSIYGEVDLSQWPEGLIGTNSGFQHFVSYTDNTAYWEQVFDENGLTNEQQLELIFNTFVDPVNSNETGLTIIGDDTSNIIDDGTAKRDTLIGNDGDDTLIGYGGNDSFEGGLGSDTVSYEYSLLAGVKVSLASGVAFTTKNDVDTLSGIENIIGTEYRDTIQGNESDNLILGGAGNDYLTGDDGNDHLIGGSGNDILFGQSDDDTVEGGDGDDTIFGDSGNDIVDGGLGADVLWGNAGNDIFVYGQLADSTNAIYDVVFDFTIGQDLMDFTALAREGISAFTDLAISQLSGNTYIDAANAALDFHIELDGVLALSDSDFIFA